MCDQAAQLTLTGTVAMHRQYPGCGQDRLSHGLPHAKLLQISNQFEVTALMHAAS